jgi:hypothetical protein
MKHLSRLTIAMKAVRQLGLQPVALNAIYRIGLVTGYFRRAENAEKMIENGALQHLFTIPSQEDLSNVLEEEGQAALLTEAEEIVAGKVRLFGAGPVNLILSLPGKLVHWTAYETGKADLGSSSIDIKQLWEPARFGWAFTLGRAYHLSGDERYAETFWQYFETFSDFNPPNFGPNWMSGQEVALRLMAFVWAGQIFDPASASTPDRKTHLALSVAAHAARIPSTLIYARSQQNNHLLTEAAGLLTAGLALPEYRNAHHWCSLGWRWLNNGLVSQIDGYGEYSQHSTNYHRLMLQVVLWTNTICNNFSSRPYIWPRKTLEAVRRSIHWLLSLMDFDSGKAPNLGANDGAYIFPLTIFPFSDYRPVLHAAARTFLDYDLPHGAWDEMARWFGLHASGPRSIALPRYLGDQLYGKQSWAYLRTAQFSTRPSHADLLHLDLWWRGMNLAQDAGTYLYNSPFPWDNSLTNAEVHNTVTVNGNDQFTRAGRFLYLDWVNAYRTSLNGEDPTILQQVRGRYTGHGYRHTRTVSVFENDRWQVQDEVLSLRKPWKNQLLTSRLHWLLPDWKWELRNETQKIEIWFTSSLGEIRLILSADSQVTNRKPSFSIVRAGEILHGCTTANPVRGWISPTYGVKVPALSLVLEVASADDVRFTTEFILPQ